MSKKTTKSTSPSIVRYVQIQDSQRYEKVCGSNDEFPPFFFLWKPVRPQFGGNCELMLCESWGNVGTGLRRVGGAGALFKGNKWQPGKRVERPLLIAILSAHEGGRALTLLFYPEKEYPSGDGAWRKHRALDKFIEGEFKKWKGGGYD